MNEILFNTLFDRKNDNPDFLRGRVVSCIKPILDEMTKQQKCDYNSAFYVSTTKFNDKLIDKFGLEFLSETQKELTNFKDLLFKIFNSENILLDLKETDYTNFLTNYYKLVKYIGYVKRSRILRRYKNFIKISNNFIKGKLPKNEYRNEVLNHILFFDKMLKNFKDINPNDICIYYFVYDIRASENVRKLKNTIKKVNSI